MNNDTTRKHPRTLSEAFGPYEDTDIESADYLYTPGEIACMWLAVLALAFIGIVAIGYFVLSLG